MAARQTAVTVTAEDRKQSRNRRGNSGGSDLRAVQFNAASRVAVEGYFALVHKNHAIAEVRHLRRAVTDEENCFVLSPKLIQPVEALLLKAHVANSENLVDDKHVRIDLGCHRKRQPDVHAGRILLNGSVDKFANFSEADDAVPPRRHFFFRVAHQQTIQHDVLAPGQLVMEASAEFEEGSNGSLHFDFSRGRPVIPAMIFSSVLFPDPLRPINPSISPR